MRGSNLLDEGAFEGEPEFSIMVLAVSSSIDQYPENEAHAYSGEDEHLFRPNVNTKFLNASRAWIFV
jgi:hypothetical protein